MVCHSPFLYILYNTKISNIVNIMFEQNSLCGMLELNVGKKCVLVTDKGPDIHKRQRKLVNGNIGKTLFIHLEHHHLHSSSKQKEQKI